MKYRLTSDGSLYHHLGLSRNMETVLRNAYIAGTERLTVWQDLLDAINVFPVPDSDTGRNLSLTLSPLRRLAEDRPDLADHLRRSASGNSGNIAASFLSHLLTIDKAADLPGALGPARDLAWQAVADPLPGTMLTVFDELAIAAEEPFNWAPPLVDNLVDRLANAVKGSLNALPELNSAGVVDAGALGMFLFFECFLQSVIGHNGPYPSPLTVFKGKLSIAPSYRHEAAKGVCIDAMVETDLATDIDPGALAKTGTSVVLLSSDHALKVHLHTQDPAGAKKEIEHLGRLVQWREDALESGELRKSSPYKEMASSPLHIMTDAAGSLNRDDANRLGISLLDSYLIFNDTCVPETHFNGADLYRMMRSGTRVTTSQASQFERSQHFQKALDQFDRVLYICVGSAYTGNYAGARAWKSENDPRDRFQVIDSTAASGRLALIALAAAAYAARSEQEKLLRRFIEHTILQCNELVFLDTLHYLAAGGRLSKTRAFFGDLLHLKPVISPKADGACKEGVVRNRAEQIDFAVKRLRQVHAQADTVYVMLQFSDNLDWIQDAVVPRLKAEFSAIEIVVHPLSLTAGTHMGPGTWAMAYLPFDKHATPVKMPSLHIMNSLKKNDA